MGREATSRVLECGSERPMREGSLLSYPTFGRPIA